MRTSVDLHNFLQAQEVPHEISLVEMPARTVEAAAALLGLDKSEIGKTLIVQADEESIVVMLPGDRRLDVRKLKKVTGASKIKLVDPEDALSLTGYILGSIPPVAHANQMQIYVDHRLLSIPLVYTCGGQTNAVLKVKPTDLITAVDAKIVDIADDGRV